MFQKFNLLDEQIIKIQIQICHAVMTNLNKLKLLEGDSTVDLSLSSL